MNDAEYTLIVAQTQQELIDAVNGHLSKGWDIEGNIAVTYEPPVNGHDYGMQYTQAMLRIKDV